MGGRGCCRASGAKVRQEPHPPGLSRATARLVPGSGSIERQIANYVPKVVLWLGDAGWEQLGQLFDTRVGQLFYTRVTGSRIF